MRVIVCGGRTYTDVKRVYEELGTLRPTRIITGGCSGADRIAQRWAHQSGTPCEVYEPDWAHWGRAAGPRRNFEMLKHGHPDVVLAFPGGRGTADMVRQAEAAGVRVIKIQEQPLTVSEFPNQGLL